MSKGNNDNDNVNVFLKNNNNVIDNVSRYEKARHVEEIADRLLDKLGMDISSRPFMCKVAWNLSEARIWDNLEQANKSKINKIGLFIYLCKRDGV